MEIIRRLVKWEHLVMILIVATLQACTKKPSAEISSSKQTAETNEYINFISTSKDADSYYWDFGDGTKSEEANPSKAYGKPGIYAVKFIAFSEGKTKFDEAMMMITISEIKNTNSYFTGTYDLDVTYDNGCISGHNTYALTIIPGAAGDEVLLENFMDKRINGLKGKVVQTSHGYKIVVLGNQEQTDNNGNTWRVVADSDYEINKMSGDNCVFVQGKISKVNGTGNCEMTYSEEGADCPSANQ